MDYKLDKLTVEVSSDKVTIYVCFTGLDSYISHWLTIEDYIGDTQEEFAETLESLARLIKSNAEQQLH